MTTIPLHRPQLLAAVPLALALACGPGGGGSDDTESESTATESQSTESESAESESAESESAESGSESGEPYDCADLPAPLIRQLDGPIAAADVAFDDQGNLVGSNTQDLFKTPSGEDAKLWVPGITGRAAMRYLPDGRLAVVQEEFLRVLLLSPEGSVSLLAANLVYPFGITVDLDGTVYIADKVRVVRIDPDTDENIEVWIPDVPGGARWLSFDVDYRAMFIGGRSTTIYRVDIDEAGQAGPLEVFGTLPVDEAGEGAPDPAPPDDGSTETGEGGGTDGEESGDETGEDETGGETGEPHEDLHLVDGLGVDACGNVYVAEFYSHALYRFGPEGGEAELLVGWEDSEYGHGLEWGSGLGEWNSRALYLPQPYNDHAVIEVDLGVPAKQRPFP